MYLFYIGFLALQVSLFSGIFYYFYKVPLFFCTCKKLFISFPLAKTSGWLININLFLLLLFQIKFIKKFFFIPFSIKYIHYNVVFYIYFWSLIHTVCHYINFYKLSVLTNLFSWGVGFTGHVLFVLFFLLLLFSIPCFRKFSFHSFLFIHYSIMFSIIVFVSIHGTFCFIKPDPKSGVNCFPPTSWAWILLPLLVLLSEIILKYSHSYYSIQNVVSYPGSIYEIKVNLPSSFAGKTVHICCPLISIFEWHPFTVSSFNSDSCSILIKIRGNWTKKFANALGINNSIVFPTVLPKIYIDGPFFCLPTDILNTIHSHTTLFISTGIGITTFHNLLVQLMLNNNYALLKNMHFVVICKKIEDIEWCLNTLKVLNNIPNFHLYLFFTREKYNEHTYVNINLPYSIGRPDFESIFNSINILHDHSSQSFVFFSGKHSILSQLKSLKNTYISNSKLYEL